MPDNETQESLKAQLSPEDAEKADNKRKKKEKQKRRRQEKAVKKKLRKQALPRSERLKIAPKWLAEYDIAVHGKNIIKAYRKHFHVEPQCALEELKILGYPLTEEQILKFHEAERSKAVQERNKKRKRRERLEAAREVRRLKQEGLQNPADLFLDSDDRFFYIAGYTSGGAPYGVTWHEMGLEPYENPFEDMDEDDSDE